MTKEEIKEIVQLISGWIDCYHCQLEDCIGKTEDGCTICETKDWEEYLERRFNNEHRR